MKEIFEKIRRNQFAIFVAGSLAVAVILVGVSLWAYNEFGTAQLDLSRPSYQEARNQAKKDAEAEKKSAVEDFSAEGKIDAKFFDEFSAKYDAKLKKLEGDFYGESALSDETLNLK